MCIIAERFPNFRDLAIHESSPATRGTSLKLEQECPQYSFSHYFKDVQRGQVDSSSGYRCESIESLTFKDNSFDLFITQDVLEHVFKPELAFKEICRVLKPGGAHIFTVPLVNKQKRSEVCARLDNQGSIDFLKPAEYHGNPIDENGSLVTMHWGYDIVSCIYRATGMASCIFTLNDLSQGIRADLIDVVVSWKSEL